MLKLRRPWKIWRTIPAKIHGLYVKLFIKIFKTWFYSWIQYFTLFLWNSHHWKTFLHMSFSFWTHLFYLTLFAVHFQLDKQIFIHCYFLLVLMPEPALYIWLRCQFCIRYSLAAFCQSPRHANLKLKIVYFQLNFWIFVYASVIIGRDKRSLCGSWRWRPINVLPWLFCPSCFLKKGVSRQHKTSTSSQNVWKCCLFRLLQLKKGLSSVIYSKVPSGSE